MRRIAIFGTGISALHLALYLQQRGVETTLFADRSPGDIRRSRLPNVVGRFGTTIASERALGIQQWSEPQLLVSTIYYYVGLEAPLSFSGHLSSPASFVDFRLYLASLQEAYTERGGAVTSCRGTSLRDLRSASKDHDLVVVATGRSRDDGHLFRTNTKQSPFRSPQRIVSAGLYTGVDAVSPPGLTVSVAPGVGELFNSPFYSFDGPTCALFFEGVIGGPFEDLLIDGEEADSIEAHEQSVLRTLRKYAPQVAERVIETSFGLARPTDLFQGGITPTVRHPWRRLGEERYAIAVGDAWVANDPITGQGANLGSRMAFILGEAIVCERVYDALFCSRAAEDMWRCAQDVVAWTNLLLPPGKATHVVSLIRAAAESQRVADAFSNNFDDPKAMFAALASPRRTEAFLREIGGKTGG